MKIGALAKSARVGVETVRFYERKGLLKKPPKKLVGFRQYSDEDSQKIRFIRRAQELGFTLKEIKELLALEQSPKATCGDVQKKAKAKIDEIQTKIRDLRRITKALEKFSSACESKDISLRDCGLLKCVESGECV